MTRQDTAYSEALEYGEQSTVVTVTPMDRETAINMKGCALVLLRRTEDGLRLLDEFCRRCLADGDLYSLPSVDGIIGVSKAIQGNIRYGIHLLEEAVLRRDKEGYRAAADWYRLNLAEVYSKSSRERKIAISDPIKESTNSSGGHV